MSILLDKQQQFSFLFLLLLQWLKSNGYTVTIGEVLRTKTKAEENEQLKIGISHSLHLLKLAVDLNIFKDGKSLESFDEYLPIGLYWESIGGSWGGRFTNRDCDHFSLSYQGVK